MDYSLVPHHLWKDGLHGQKSQSGAGWVDFEDTISLFDRYPLDIPGRLIMASDGSLTSLLETLYLSPIDVEVKNQEIGKVGEAMAGYLGVDASTEAVNRDAWLVKERKRLVYAHSVFPLNSLPQGLLEKLTKGEEPLGHLLKGHNLFTLKDNWQIGVILCEAIAQDLGLPDDTRFWARRYRLFIHPSEMGLENPAYPAGRGVTAGIMEVFSPEILSGL